MARGGHPDGERNKDAFFELPTAEGADRVDYLVPLLGEIFVVTLFPVCRSGRILELELFHPGILSFWGIILRSHMCALRQGWKTTELA